MRPWRGDEAPRHPHDSMQPSDRLFLESAADTTGRAFDLQEFDRWFEQRAAAHRFSIDRIPFAELDRWSFAPDTGNLRHDSGRFFSIEGITVETNFGEVARWNQPIINQPEIGFLGFIGKRIDGVFHLLMQAKMEPGNIRFIQLAPTLQATKSNYTRVHQGKAPPFLERFRGAERRDVIVDVLQSEQGGRFLRKRNRNIVVRVADDEALDGGDDFIWLSLGQIRELLQRDNVINMDARTVLACLSYASAADAGRPALNEMDAILAWFTELKCRYELEVRRISLPFTNPWYRDDHRIAHPTGNYFEVIAVRVEADNREVGAWTQPIVRPCRPGLVAFITRDVEGEPHFLMQGKVEAGNFDVVEMAPTVQCLTGDYQKAPTAERPHFLDHVLAAPPERIRFDTMQSEEGGRFYREENRNLIVDAGEDFPQELPPNFIWVSYTQLKTLVRFNNIVNVQARCLLSAVPPPYPLDR